jgi:hypothetical protein
VGLITPDLSGIVDGQVGDAVDWTAPFNTITNEINGRLDTNNFTAAGTNLSTIAQSTAWTTFTPTWTGSGSNPAIGNGTLSGAYMKVGRTVHFRINIVPGSTTTFGSGTYTLSLPFTASTGFVQLTTGRGRKSGTSNYHFVGTIASGATTIASFDQLNSNNDWTNTSPFTFANGDSFYCAGTYEASS